LRSAPRSVVSGDPACEGLPGLLRRGRFPDDRRGPDRRVGAPRRDAVRAARVRRLFSLSQAAREAHFEPGGRRRMVETPAHNGALMISWTSLLGMPDLASSHGAAIDRTIGF